MHLEDFKSQFATIELVMSSTRLDHELLSYMSIIEEIFSMSIDKPDGFISYEQVIADIDRDLIEHSLDNGFDNQFLELISIKVKFETKNYSKAIDWLYNITRYVKFEKKRILTIVNKIINSLPDKKRNGELMMYSSQYRHLFNKASLRKAQDSVYTETFYQDVLAKINDGKFAEIEDDLNTIKNNYSV